jgi:histone chaperone ASF1
MLVNVLNVEVLNNPTSIDSHLQFQITFECLEPGVTEPLEWSVIHTILLKGNTNDTIDTELDSVEVGPVRVGKNKFVFDVPPPDVKDIPRDELLDMTGLVLAGAYRGKVFIRVGYFTRVEFPFELELGQDERPILPDVIDYSQLIRNVASDKPRVTRYIIPWDNQGDDIVQIEQQPLEAMQQAYLEQHQANGDDQIPEDVFMGDYEEDDDASEEDEVEIDLSDDE